jgi:hypothetical protein
MSVLYLCKGIHQAEIMNAAPRLQVGIRKKLTSQPHKPQLPESRSLFEQA